MYKFTEKSDIDKLDSYIKSLLYIMSNKPLESATAITSQEGRLDLFNIKYFIFMC
jgi:hypothetical protein